MIMKKIKLMRAPYNPGENIYSKATFSFETGITILAGCNGSGKTTLIMLLKEYLDKSNIPYYCYDSYAEGRSISFSKDALDNNLDITTNSLCVSEGEKIAITLVEEAKKIGDWCRQNEDKSELWLFFDAIDSGLSIDNIIDIKDYLFKAIIDYNEDKDIYIICSTNSYEFANGSKCLDVYSANYITFKDYDDYKKFIIKSQKRKNKRLMK